MGGFIGDMWSHQCERSDRRYVDNDDRSSLCTQAYVMDERDGIRVFLTKALKWEEKVAH